MTPEATARHESRKERRDREWRERCARRDDGRKSKSSAKQQPATPVPAKEVTAEPPKSSSPPPPTRSWADVVAQGEEAMIEALDKAMEG